MDDFVHQFKPNKVRQPTLDRLLRHIHEGIDQLPSLVSHIFFNSSLRYLDTNIEGWEGSVQANEVVLELCDIEGAIHLHLYSTIESYSDMGGFTAILHF